MIGTIGEVALVKNEPHFAIKNVGLFKSRSEADGKWLYYYLRTDFAQNYLREISRGTTQQYVPLGSLREMPIYVFDDKSEMSRIANILGTLDDKIENNRKTAKTLEAMAQAIFQSWFVDFDPVRAKMAGESPESICKRLKLTPEILDLFPNRLMDSELGEIPEGWVDGSLGNICSRRSARIGNRDAKVLSAVTEGRLAISDDYFTKRVYSKDIKNYLAVEWYDFAYNPSRINIGSIGMLESHFLGAVSPVYVVFRPVEGYQQFIKLYLRLATTKQWIANFSSGSVRQSLSYDDFAAIPSVIPPKVIIDVFSSIHDFMKHSTDSLYECAIKTSGLRDAILPKLISGEIRVPGLDDGAGQPMSLSSILMFISAFVTFCLVCVTAWMAYQTKRLANYNQEIVKQNRALSKKNDALIQQSERQHKERLRPLCFPITQDSNVIDFNKAITMGAPSSNHGPGIPPHIEFLVCNKGLGPAINLRFHINDIHNRRITKDFMVTHVLPPNEENKFVSHIPPLNMLDENGGLFFGMEPSQVVNDAYFIICEYGSMFSKETFHSIVAKGYRDPSLAGDGKNQWRLNRPLTPPVEFRLGLDPSKPIWPLPPEDANYSAEFLNLSSPPENGQST